MIIWIVYPFNRDTHSLLQREMGHLQSSAMAAMGQICPYKRCSIFCMPQNISSYFGIYMCNEFNPVERQCGFKMFQRFPPVFIYVYILSLVSWVWSLEIATMYRVACHSSRGKTIYIIVQPAKSQASHFPQEQHRLAWQSRGQCQGRKAHPAVPSSSTGVE